MQTIYSLNNLFLYKPAFQMHKLLLSKHYSFPFADLSKFRPVYAPKDFLEVSFFRWRTSARVKEIEQLGLEIADWIPGEMFP